MLSWWSKYRKARSPDIVIEPVTERGFSGSPWNSSPSQHTHQRRLLPCSYVSILQKQHLAPRRDLRFHNSGFCSNGSQRYRVTLRYFLCLKGCVICHVLSHKGWHLCTCSFPHDHYLLTHFQRDRSLVFLGIKIFFTFFTHSGEGCLEGPTAMHIGIETSPQRQDFPLMWASW